MTNFYVPETITLADDTSLLELGIVDSTGVLEVTAFLEGEYGIEIADHEIVPANMDSITCDRRVRRDQGRSGGVTRGRHEPPTSRSSFARSAAIAGSRSR